MRLSLFVPLSFTVWQVLNNGESKKGHCVEIEQQVKCASCECRLGVKDLTATLKVSHS